MGSEQESNSSDKNKNDENNIDGSQSALALANQSKLQTERRKIKLQETCNATAKSSPPRPGGQRSESRDFASEKREI